MSNKTESVANSNTNIKSRQNTKAEINIYMLVMSERITTKQQKQIDIHFEITVSLCERERDCTFYMYFFWVKTKLLKRTKYTMEE